MFQVEGECWGAFRSALQDCERGEGGIMPLRDAHETYVTEVASRCFIDSEEEVRVPYAPRNWSSCPLRYAHLSCGSYLIVQSGFSNFFICMPVRQHRGLVEGD